jgi:cytidylate kinase
MSTPSTTPIITIDGPAASGKSSLSRELAKRLGWKWVSTGAFYRALAFVAYQQKIDLSDAAALVHLAQQRELWSVRMDPDATRTIVRGQDVTQEIQSEDNGTRASQLSKIPEVRQALLKNQRDCALQVPGLIAEGRDCGTVVFPQAILKVYLTASQQERAARRAREQGLDVVQTQTQQVVRDQQDSSRTAAPLQVPADAKVIDSNGIGLNEVVKMVHQWATEALARSVKSF